MDRLFRGLEKRVVDYWDMRALHRMKRELRRSVMLMWEKRQLNYKFWFDSRRINIYFQLLIYFYGTFPKPFPNHLFKEGIVLWFMSVSVKIFMFFSIVPPHVLSDEIFAKKLKDHVSVFFEILDVSSVRFKDHLFWAVSHQVDKLVFVNTNRQGQSRKCVPQCIGS